MKTFNEYKFQDDEMSLQALANGNGTLDLIYDWQFVQNETCTGDPYHIKLSHTPIGEATLTGTIYHDGHAIQTFLFLKDGQVQLNKIDTPKGVHPGRVRDAKINLQTGDIYFFWYGKPQNAYFVVSYEYNIECQYSLPVPGQ